MTEQQENLIRATSADTGNHLDIFLELLMKSFDGDNIPVMPGILEHVDGSITVISFMISPIDTMKTISRMISKPDVIKAITGIDTYTKPDQGTTLDSAVHIWIIEKGKPTQMGVLEYESHDGAIITKDINWNNKFWKKRNADILIQFDNIAMDA